MKKLKSLYKNFPKNSTQDISEEFPIIDLGNEEEWKLVKELAWQGDRNKIRNNFFELNILF